MDTRQARVTRSQAVEDKWLAETVRFAEVGHARLSRSPSLYVTVELESLPALRIDVYAHGSAESYVFEEAVVWGEYVFLGFGHHVYVVTLDGEVAAQVDLGTYFGSFTMGPAYLLIGSSTKLLRFDAEARRVWESDDLGIDGVVVHTADATSIRGMGEWDPPGGWEPFVLDSLTGARR